jgi:predicted transcriptional regulator
MTKRNVYVGGTLRDVADRVAEKWKRAARGERVVAEDNVTFVTWDAFASVMTGKRHELLRHLHRHPAPSVLALSRELGRDYRRVHADVAALEQVGLIERSEKGSLRADYKEIVTVIPL